MNRKMQIISMVYLIGIILGYYFDIPKIIIIISMVLLSAAIFLNRKRLEIVFIISMVSLCIMGMIEYDQFSQRTSSYETFEGKKVKIEGILLDDPALKGIYTQGIMKAIGVSYEGKIYNYTEKMLLKVKGNEPLSYGDRIVIDGYISAIEGIRNPGDFDYSLYYKSKGIEKQLVSQRIERISKNQNNFFFTQLHITKMRMKGIIYSSLPDEEASLLYGIITGDKNDLDEETRDNYSKVGLSHILSVSGLHIGFVVLFLSIFLNLFHIKEKNQNGIIIIIVFAYIMMIGAPSPAIRAFIMLLILLLAKEYKRDYNLITSISFALFLMLIINPLYIHDVGFVISYACMYSIALFYPPLLKKLAFMPRIIRSAFALSLAVQLGIIPITAYYFNYVSLISIFINTIAVPLSFIITLTGFVGVFIGFLFNNLAIYVFSIAYYSIYLLDFLVEKSASLTFAGLVVPHLPIYLYCVYYFSLLYIIDWFELKWYKLYKREFMGAAAILFIMALIINIAPGRNLKAVFFDVGQGDGACIITPSHKVVLIDGGGSSRNPEYYFNVGKKITVPALLHQGVWKIDTIIASHIHDDHIEGLIEVLHTFQVKRILFPNTPYTSKVYEELIALCKEKRTDIIYLTKGDRVQFDQSVYIDILSPSDKLIIGSSSDENSNSLVGLLAYKNFRILYTGDIQKESEVCLSSIKMDCDILKVAHHGSNTSSSEAFIKSVSPTYSIISVGKNNYGHPSKITIESLEKYNKRIFRTDENGAVTVITNGNLVTIKTVK